jgi:hypothetical protein
MGLINVTLARFLIKYLNIPNISSKKEFGIKRIKGAWFICEPWFTGSQTLGDLHISQSLNQVFKKLNFKHKISIIYL